MSFLKMIALLRNLDLALFELINQKMRNPFLDFFFEKITHLGDFYGPWLIISLLLIILGKDSKAKNVGVLCFLSLLLNAFLTNALLQPVFNRARPYDVLKNVSLLVPKTSFLSFPSGHASGSFAFATVVSFGYRRFTLPLYLLASLIAFSRIYIGVHYPADVFAGAITGTSVALLVIFLKKQLTTNH